MKISDVVRQDAQYEILMLLRRIFCYLFAEEEAHAEARRASYEILNILRNYKII